ncbi:SMC5-SMC6 complex localization factor protein 1-like isoform X2 [Penaeus indicus]|uniref:SMC5-SMC6 complex localization factor protein 1-like isoform X2 n=1 Tax=Penaeus indicus TaxID=29960 RepID=UPI00300C9E37
MSLKKKKDMIVKMSACSPKKMVKRFLISGVHNQEELQTIRKKIVELGGKVEDNVKNSFISLCTHVLVKEFNMTEKVLGGLASGKWLVQPEFILDSHRQGKWLEESQYEIKEFVECRQKRNDSNIVLYSGWKVYVKLENNTLTKSFRRVTAAGGAEIISLKEISQSDFIITEKNMAASIRETVGPNIPIVCKTYIKDTIIRGVSPSDLRPYLLDACGNAQLARKVDLTRPQIRNGDIQPKKLLSEMQMNTYKKNVFGVTYQQPRLDQYVRIESPGKLPQACSPVRRTPSSSRKRRYQFCQVTPEKQQPSIVKYFIKKESNLEVRSARNGEIRVTEDGNDNDIEVIGETSRSGTGNMLSSNRMQEAGNECVHPCTIDLTGTSHEESVVSVDISNEVVCLGNEMTVSCSIDKENRVDSSDLPIDDTIDADELKRDSATILKGVKEDKNLSKEVFRTATDITRADVSSTVQNELIEESSSTKMLDAQCLLKKVSVNIGPRIDEWLSPATAPVNTIEQSAACNLPVKEKIKETSRQMKIDNEEVKRSIGRFIRKSKRVSGIYSSDIVVIDSEMSKEQSIPKNFQSAELSNQESDVHASPEVRELSVEEVSYFESSIDEDVRGIQMFAAGEQSIIVTGMDSLDLSVTPYTYPPSSLFGDLLRRLILETRFTIVSSYALNMAHKILSLHPPKSSRWRTYYYEVFAAALQTQEGVSLQAWRFIHHVIECSLSDIDEEDYNTDTDAEDTTIIRENALSLLRFIVLVLREDMKHWNKREAINHLLSWKIFLGQLTQPTLTTSPVKHLLQIWVAVQSADPAVRQCVADLVSVLLEVLWKYEKTFLLPVSPLPKSIALFSTEFLLQVKDLGSSHLMKLINSFSSPWPKMVVSSVIFQEITRIYNQIINLADIVDFSQAVVLSPCTSTSPSPVASQSKKTSSPSKKFRLGQNVNKKNCKGETTLLRACIKNNVEKVQELLNVPGIDINLPDNFGWTPLHEAAIRGHNECIKLLLSFTSYDTLLQNNSLYPYAKGEHFSHMVHLTAKGGDDRQTPLHDAVVHNQLETAKLLLEYGGEPLLDEENFKGETPLALAATDEMRTLLRSFLGKPSSKYSACNKNQATIKTSVIANGLSKLQDILPCYEDRHSFVIQFINCYLEASGTRSIYFEIQRACRRPDSERGAGKNGASVAVTGESSDRGRKNSSGYQSDSSVCESKGSWSSGESVVSSSSSTPLPAKQCLVHTVGVTCEIEQRLIKELFERIKIDLKLFSEFKVRFRPKPVDESDYLLNLKWQFL